MSALLPAPPVQVLKALGDPVRLRILELLARPEVRCCAPRDRVCACELEPLLGLAQPTISHHMKLLADAGLVEAKKDGKFVYYSIHMQNIWNLSRWLADFTGESRQSLVSLSPEDPA